MKKIVCNIMIFTVIPFSANATEFAALAIDKGNGSAYGWSYNQPSLSSAEAYAQNECSKRSGRNCSIVLSWSGEGCGVYRTVDKKLGTTYGWGIAKTQVEADKIANQEVLKRSNGVSAPNFVWACNTTDKNKLKVLKNDNQIVKTVKIGSQVWMAENLNVAYFQNGDLIPLAKSAEEWRVARDTQKPMSRILDDTASNAKKYGRYYNWSVATDPRGICPTGFHLPTKAEWEVLIRTLGDTSTVGKKLKSRSNWKQVGWSGTEIGRAHV